MSFPPVYVCIFYIISVPYMSKCVTLCGDLGEEREKEKSEKNGDGKCMEILILSIPLSVHSKKEYSAQEFPRLYTDSFQVGNSWEMNYLYIIKYIAMQTIVMYFII